MDVATDTPPGLEPRKTRFSHPHVAFALRTFVETWTVHRKSSPTVTFSFHRTPFWGLLPTLTAAGRTVRWPPSIPRRQLPRGIARERGSSAERQGRGPARRRRPPRGAAGEG